MFVVCCCCFEAMFDLCYRAPCNKWFQLIKFFVKWHWFTLYFEWIGIIMLHLHQIYCTIFYNLYGGSKCSSPFWKGSEEGTLIILIKTPKMCNIFQLTRKIRRLCKVSTVLLVKMAACQSWIFAKIWLAATVDRYDEHTSKSDHLVPFILLFKTRYH